MQEHINHENGNIESHSHEQNKPTESDLSSKFLSEALQKSFLLLKLIMVVLVVLFLVSGFKTIESDERAIVLRFGKIRPVGQNRTLGPGPHWVWPYPIEEIVRIPSVEKRINLSIDSHWYRISKTEQVTGKSGRVEKSLNPEYDGYCLVRSDQQVGSSGNDYNIVHSKWRLIYQIRNPELFFRNVSIEDVKPGEDYFEVVTKSVEPLMTNMIDEAVVSTMVHYTIEESILSKSSISVDVRNYMQQKLDEIQSGIDVSSAEMTDVTWPRQVNIEFQYAMQAQQESQQVIQEAEGYARETLSKAGGSDPGGLPLADKILDAMKSNKISQEEIEQLWVQLAGEAREIIADARAYRTRVISDAKANADYLMSILPEYQKHPDLVMQTIYQEAIEEIFTNVEEKIIVQPTKGSMGNQIWVNLNRDPSIKKETQK